MILSAFAFAAALQAAPDITLKGYPLGMRPADRAQPVGELTVAPRKQRVWAVAPPRTFKLVPPRTRPPTPKKDFVVNPQMVNCKSIGPELVSSSEKLRAVPLAKMPKAHGERAVARLVDGCPVAVTIAQGPASF